MRASFSFPTVRARARKHIMRVSIMWIQLSVRSIIIHSWPAHEPLINLSWTSHEQLKLRMPIGTDGIDFDWNSSSSLSLHSWACENLFIIWSWRLVFFPKCAGACTKAFNASVDYVHPAICSPKNHSLMTCSWTINRSWIFYLSYAVWSLLNSIICYKLLAHEYVDSYVASFLKPVSHELSWILQRRCFCHSWISHNSYSGLSWK